MRELARTRFAFGWAPRRMGWWLWLGACLVGAFTLGAGLAPGIATFPVVTLAAVLFTVPLVVSWWWILRMPQLWGRVSRSGAVAAALWGAFAAAGVYALPANGALIAVIGQRAGIDFASEWGAALIAPLTEETGKAMAIAAVLLATGQRVRTPMDAALLAGYSAVGFTATEDLLYALNIGYLNLGENQLVSTTVIYLARAVIFGAVSHVVFSWLVGAGVGLLAVGRRPGRIPLGFAFVVAGLGLHGVWNSPIPVWARFVYPVVGGVVLWLALRTVRREEFAWFTQTLSRPGALGTIPAVYLDAVKATWWKRRSYRAGVVRTYGFAAKGPQRDLEAALTDLADAVDVGDAAAATTLRQDLAAKLAVPS